MASSADLEVFSDLTSLPLYARGAVVLLGSFDGLHRGHQRLIGTGRAIADRSGRKLAIFSVEPHPREFFGATTAPFRLVDASGKLALFKQYDVDLVYSPRFDGALAALSPESFVQDVLIGEIQASHIVVGADYRFGKKRAGDAAALVMLAAGMDCSTTVVSKLKEGDSEISSSRVRALVREGEVARARSLLGHHWPVHFSDPVQLSVDEWGRPWAIGCLGAVLTPQQGRFQVDLRCLWRGETCTLPGYITFHPADAEAPSRWVVVEMARSPPVTEEVLEGIERLSVVSALVHGRI